MPNGQLIAAGCEQLPPWHGFGGAIFPAPMAGFHLPAASVPADLPRDIRLQIVSPGSEPPDGDGWLHEIKHDGHRLLAIVAGDTLRLLSRNGRDRKAPMRVQLRSLLTKGRSSATMPRIRQVRRRNGGDRVSVVRRATINRRSKH